MSPSFRLALPLLLAALAACTSPQEQCLTSANSALAALDSQIQVAQANLARGFAVQQVTRNVPQATSCSNVSRSDTLVTANSMCIANNVQTVDVRVDIDPVVEQRRLDQMIASRPAVAQQSAAAASACRAQYPL
jgi:hypothetical protein